MNFEIIKATKESAVDMGYIHATSWKAAYKDLASNELLTAFTPENRAEIFRDVIGSRPEEYYLFKVDGDPAGLAMLHKSHEKTASPSDGEIYAIYFHPAYWGHEATHLAFEFCIDRLKALGYKNLFIWVLEKNVRARKFYEKYGFEFDGKQETINLGTDLIQVRYAKK